MARLVRLSLLLVGMLVVITACGAQAAATPPPTAASVPPPTLAPVTPQSAAPGMYDDIPQGVTAEGYQYLGNPDARLTLVMYSDFL